VEQALVTQAGIPFRAVQTGQVRGKDPITMLKNLGKMVVGVKESLALLKEIQPQVCLVTGGYVCIPVAVACRLRGIPMMIYLPDMNPGLAVKALSLLAKEVAVSFPEVQAHFGQKAVVTGYPVRPELIQAAQDRFASRQILADRLGIPMPREEADTGESALPLLLVFGGSRGARSINQAIWGQMAQLLTVGHILHIVGERDWPMLEEAMPDLPEDLARRYHPVPYLHDEMAQALAGADLVVARAGASTLGEFPIAHLPAILVPLPLTGVQQAANAQKLADTGGALIIEDADLARDLAPVVVDLLTDEKRRLKMGGQMASLARPQAALNIASRAVQLAG
jgi:UDP-N-acetylglucosamine--N-acetylmuramyl-(pentapeptide) pyrophosphoryl-undecaprenol N-acetylglucosamine transferase